MASLVVDPKADTIAKADQPGIGFYCTPGNLHLLRGGTEEEGTSMDNYAESMVQQAGLSMRAGSDGS